MSISGRNWHSVAYDEAHEMLINKDLKTAIVRPNHEYMSRLALCFAHRTQALKNLKGATDTQKQVTLPGRETCDSTFSDTSTRCSKAFENVKQIITVITSTSLLPHPKPESTTLRNSFSGKVATPQQRKDLLEFRDIGQRDFKQYVLIHTLHKSSAKSTRATKHHLQTFAKPKLTKQRLSAAERDAQTVALCLRKRLIAKSLNPESTCTNEQYIELPRAIADANGLPHKSEKKVLKRIDTKSCHHIIPQTGFQSV